jgi:hypothetical protein
MYEKEGGSGELFGEGSLFETLSSTAKLFYEGVYTPKTPSQYDALVEELAEAGLDLPGDIEARSIINGIYKSYELLTKIPDSKRGQVQGRFQEYTSGEERDEDVQAFKSQVSMVGMFLARLVEKGRLSDKDREFYLAQMPNLKQSSDDIAYKSADTLAKLVAEKFSIDANTFSANEIQPTNLDSIMQNDYILIQDPDTGEIFQFDKGTYTQEEVIDSLNDGYILIE